MMLVPGRIGICRMGLSRDMPIYIFPSILRSFLKTVSVMTDLAVKKCRNQPLKGIKTDIYNNFDIVVKLSIFQHAQVASLS